MTETEKIKERYDRRKSVLTKAGGLYSEFIEKERILIYEKIINDSFNSLHNIRVLEIGAGNGGNIQFFKTLGIKPDLIFANELLEDRLVNLKQAHPDIHVLPGNALDISGDHKFDIIFQSTVFTSILDDEFRRKLADKMKSLLNPGGIILWYDFVYNNPKNKDVKGVSRKEVKRLFSDLKFVYGTKCTLAPPIGRRVGKLYSFFNSFSFLRTHFIAVFRK